MVYYGNVCAVLYSSILTLVLPGQQTTSANTHTMDKLRQKMTALRLEADENAAKAADAQDAAKEAETRCTQVCLGHLVPCHLCLLLNEQAGFFADPCFLLSYFASFFRYFFYKITGGVLTALLPVSALLLGGEGGGEMAIG